MFRQSLPLPLPEGKNRLHPCRAHASTQGTKLQTRFCAKLRRIPGKFVQERKENRAESFSHHFGFVGHDSVPNRALRADSSFEAASSASSRRHGLLFR